jgi:hypothetical protein
VRKEVIVEQNNPPETYSDSTIIFKFVMFIGICFGQDLLDSAYLECRKMTQPW